MTVIATTTASTRHTIRLVHGSTGDTIRAIALSPLALPFGWWARIADGTIVIASAGPVAAGPPSVDVIVTDGILASALTFPAPAPHQPPNSVRVALAAAAIDVPIAPIDMVLTVELRKATGPSQGKTVTVRGASGTPTVTLTEGAPGVYSSPPRQWGANLINADLRIGSTAVRKVTPDFTRTETRIHAVDPT